MNLLFTHAYYINEDGKEQQIMRPYVPLGILYLSAYLEEKGVINELYDTTFESKSKQFEFIRKSKPEVLAIYVNLMTKVNVIELIQKIKADELLSNTKIVLGGPDVTYNYKNYLEAGADFIIIGEGEETMHELYQCIVGKTNNYQDIQGLAYYECGEIVLNQPREKIKDVDNFPVPNRKKVNIQQYLNTWKEHHGFSSMTVSTQRGCPYTCKWCSTAVYGLSYRRRSPKLVVDELETLMNTYKPDTFWFVDDVFTVSHKWLKEFSEEIQRRKVKISFECISRADRMNEEVIEWLKKAGCIRVWIGAESGSQKIIEAMDRRVDVEKVREMIVLCRNNGIEAGTFIMLGYPGETQNDIDLTIEHLITSNPDYFTITVAYPIKGTALFQEIEGIQTNIPDWNTSTDRDRDFKRTYSRRYYEFAVRHVVNEVNYHKTRLKGQHLSSKGLKLFVKSKIARTAMNLERLISQ